MARLVSLFLILLLKIYQHTLSRVFAFLGVRCRHEPTCSSYGIAAIKAHGPWTGGWLTLSRLLRCHPFGSHGWDPVPVTDPSRGKLWEIWKLGDWSWRPRGVETSGRNRSCVRGDQKENERDHD